MSDGELKNRSDFLDILHNARSGDTIMVHAATRFGKSYLLCYTLILWQKGSPASDTYSYLYLLPVRRIGNHEESLERIRTKDLNLLKEVNESKLR